MDNKSLESTTMTDGFQDVSPEATMAESDDVDEEEEQEEDDDNEEQSSESEQDTDSEDEEDASDKNPWETLRQDVQESLSRRYDKQVDKFLNEGTSEAVAEAKAFNALLPVYYRELRRLYLHYLH